jgi:hypothetical protein
MNTQITVFDNINSPFNAVFMSVCIPLSSSDAHSLYCFFQEIEKKLKINEKRGKYFEK